MHESRNTLGAHARELVMRGRSEGATTEGQHAICEKVFHGSGGYASVLQLFLDGKGQYASMFDRVDIENGLEGNELRDGQSMLVLKPLFSCMPGT